jgi:hypothetical protein
MPPKTELVIKQREGDWRTSVSKGQEVVRTTTLNASIEHVSKCGNGDGADLEQSNVCSRQDAEHVCVTPAGQDQDGIPPRNWLRYIVVDGGFCYVLQYQAPVLAAFFGSRSFAGHVQMNNGLRSLSVAQFANLGRKEYSEEQARGSFSC